MMMSLAVGVLLSILGPAALAQTQLPTTDLERQSKQAREQKKQQAAAEAAEAEARRREAPGETATYKEVLANPDDVALNYRFAISQIRGGDLKGASATLERILLVNPDLADIRLLYAVVLYRLNDLSESQRELETLGTATLPAPAAKERGEYLTEVRKRLKKTHLTGRLSAGWEYDSNRNAAPATGQRLFQDVPFQLTGTGAKRSDTSMLFLGNVEARRDLPHGHQVFGTFDYYRSEQTQIKQLNLQAYSVSAGGALRPAPGWEVTPEVLFDHVLLDQSTFLRNRGADVRVERSLNRRTAVFGEVRDEFNDFVNTRDLPIAADRTGIQADFTAGVERVLTPTNKLTASYTHSMKHASQAFWAFSREGLDLSDLWLLGRGTFLLTSGTFHWDRYSRPDPSVSPVTRRDDTWRLALTYGVPLGIVHPKLKDVLATFNYEYYQATSNIENWAFTNNKVSALLTYRWELGL